MQSFSSSPFPRIWGKRDVPLSNVKFLYFSPRAVLLWGFSLETSTEKLGALQWLLQKCWLQEWDPGASEVLWLEWQAGRSRGGNRAAPVSSQESLVPSALINTSPPFLWQNILCVLGGLPQGRQFLCGHELNSQWNSHSLCGKAQNVSLPLPNWVQSLESSPRSEARWLQRRKGSEILLLSLCVILSPHKCRVEVAGRGGQHGWSCPPSLGKATVPPGFTALR